MRNKIYKIINPDVCQCLLQHIIYSNSQMIYPNDTNNNLSFYKEIDAWPAISIYKWFHSYR